MKSDIKRTNPDKALSYLKHRIALERLHFVMWRLGLANTNLLFNFGGYDKQIAFVERHCK